jgi:hypothetical protein
MKEMFGAVGAVVVVTFLIVAVGVGGSIGSYYLYAYLAPKYESTRRDVMLQSRAYSEGETRNLYRLKIQLEAAPSPEAKQTIRLAAQHECEALDRSRLPADLSAFCNPMGQ